MKDSLTPRGEPQFHFNEKSFFEFISYHNSMDDLKKDNTKIHAEFI